VKPPPFEYHRPQNLAALFECIRSLDGEVRLLAGGQSLVPILNFRLARPDYLVDINDLVELDYVKGNEDTLEIGALVRHERLASDPQIRSVLPLLAHAASSIGHYAIRTRGTLGGSLAHADPAAQLPLVTVILDADILCRSADGERTIPAADFFISVMTTALEQGEVVVGIRVPVTPPTMGWGFELFSLRHGDFAIASVAALVALTGDGSISDLRVAVGGLEVRPRRFDNVTDAMLGQQPDDACIDQVAAAVQGTCEVQASRIPADYRLELAFELTRRAVRNAIGRAQRTAQR
jgi:aerobic carbon-monoxide dehydrogenase medium subunit